MAFETDFFYIIIDFVRFQMVFQIIDYLSGTKSCTLMLAKFAGKGMLFDVRVKSRWWKLADVKCFHAFDEVGR
jgi:hypothetical protein